MPGWPPATLRRIPWTVVTLARVRRKLRQLFAPFVRAAFRSAFREQCCEPTELSTPAAALVGRIGDPNASVAHSLGDSASGSGPVFEHVFDILGSGPQKLVSADYRSSRWRADFDALTEGLPDTFRGAYEPIEWHSDFTSGYQWDPTASYTRIRVAPEPRAEIKIPRELSRFHHVGVLGSSGTERDAIEFLLQTADWIAANPLGRGVNWASTMDVGIRAVNWIWGARLLAHRLNRFHRPVSGLMRSLREHGQHISQNLDFYEEATNNHYLANLAGLLYIGCACPEMPEADHWVHFGLHQLVSEMSREVYPDGMDFEASTHYHRLVAEMFLSCAALAERLPAERRARIASLPLHRARAGLPLRPLAEVGVELDIAGPVFPDWFCDRLLRMVEFTAALTKPNGCVPQFGDNDSGRLHKLGRDTREDVRDHRHICAVGGVFFARSDLIAVGSPAAEEGALIAGGLARIRSTHAADVSARKCVFPDAGIVVLRDGQSYLAVTCGPNGLNGRGGHGHNDKGSFDLTIGADDFVADGGCSVYTTDPALRNSLRSTSAHSTAWVVGAEQDPIPPGPAGLFRLPERARRKITTRGDDTVVCEHDGFGVIHRRVFLRTRGRLEIADELDTPAPWQVGFNLDPAVSPQVGQSGSAWVVHLRHESGREILLRVSGVSRVRATRGIFSYGYGRSVENWRLIADAADSRVVSSFDWDGGG